MLQYVPRSTKLEGGWKARAWSPSDGRSGSSRRWTGSPLRAYQDLVIGSRSLARLVLYELVLLVSSWVPGALGLLLRKLLLPAAARARSAAA